ncbi:Uncharacterized protein TCM_008417 [Theobroma cacao]|uniref:Uncharacterized protein n=1 Tax=Theobroma cacao TaxID=3641 RepID=A0A061E3W4_THECC|nr:Uncharacterized protein TCM_008417 [Theobroma cacao]
MTIHGRGRWWSWQAKETSTNKKATPVKAISVCFLLEENCFVLWFWMLSYRMYIAVLGGTGTMLIQCNDSSVAMGPIIFVVSIIKFSLFPGSLLPIVVAVVIRFLTYKFSLVRGV